MTPGDRLREAVGKLPLAFGPDKYGISTCPWCGSVWDFGQERHKAGCVYVAIRDALAAYDAAPRVTEEVVARAVMDALDDPYSTEPTMSLADARVAARAAAKAMGQELKG